MKMVDLPSPNFDERDGQAIDTLVLHYTGMKTAQAALDRLCDSQDSYRVSSHYVVDEDGTVYKLVEEDKRAWHAGRSSWRGNSNLNQRSIGIEIVNPGHEYGYRPFTEPQIQSVIALCQDIVARHNIPAWNVVGHSDIAPDRKEDPGELFPWARLAAAGVGLWAKQPGLLARWMSRPEKSIQNLEQNFKNFGYNIDITGENDELFHSIIRAFQRHFRPQKVDGRWDAECQCLLKSLLKQTRGASI